MEAKVKASIEVGTRRIITGSARETIEVSFTVGRDRQKDGFGIQIKNMMDGDWIYIVEQRSSRYHYSVRNVDKLAKSTPFIDALPIQDVCSTSIITPVAEFFREQFARMIEDGWF